MLNSVLFIFFGYSTPIFFLPFMCQSLTSEIHFISFWWLTCFSCLQSITQMDSIDISPYQFNSIDIRCYHWDIGLFTACLSPNHSTAHRLESQAPWYKIQGIGHSYPSLLYHISFSCWLLWFLNFSLLISLKSCLAHLWFCHSWNYQPHFCPWKSFFIIQFKFISCLCIEVMILLIILQITAIYVHLLLLL